KCVTELTHKFNYNYIAGIDEVGRGALAGPVVAAAVILNNTKNIPDAINDSKKISKKLREKLYNLIITDHRYAIGMASNTEIDQINILQATKLAMRRAVYNLSTPVDALLIDGNQKIDLHKINLPNMIYQQTVVKGDSKSLTIAAASIIAKVTRDNIMSNMSIDFPDYNWQKNVGYGTKEHLSNMKKFGVCKYHRKTFKPVVENI
ncbi:MAG: ribonuclease HII, partial [Pseudomonadota bacterium]